MLITILLAVILIVLLGLGVALRKGLNEVIRGLESIDQRLASLAPPDRDR